MERGCPYLYTGSKFRVIWPSVLIIQRGVATIPLRKICLGKTLRRTSSLWATVAPHAPPGGFSETTIFMILIHIAIGTRVPAKILMLDKAVRALFFSKWLPKRCKCYNFIILKQICFIFNHCLEQKEYRIVQIWIIFHQLSQDGVFLFKMAAKIPKFKRNGNVLTKTVYDQSDIATLLKPKHGRITQKRGRGG